MKRINHYFLLISSVILFAIGCAKEQSLTQSKEFRAVTEKALHDSIALGDTTRHDTIPHDSIPYHDTIPGHPADTIPHHDTIPWHPADTIPWIDTVPYTPPHNDPPPIDTVPGGDSTSYTRRRFTAWGPKAENLYQTQVPGRKDVYYNEIVTYWSKNRFIG